MGLGGKKACFKVIYYISRKCLWENHKIGKGDQGGHIHYSLNKRCAITRYQHMKESRKNFHLKVKTQTLKPYLNSRKLQLKGKVSQIEVLNISRCSFVLRKFQHMKYTKVFEVEKSRFT